MNKLKITILIVLLPSIMFAAERVVNVCGEADYYVPESMSLAQAKIAAVNMARNNAIEKEFGIQVSSKQQLISTERGVDNDSFYFSQSSSELKGVWLADTKEPIMDINYKDGEMIIHVSVCGKAREQKTSKAELVIDVLRNGQKATEFVDGDKMSLRFKSSVKGYVAVFVVDADKQKVYCMMPYDTEENKGYAREVRNNKDYVFLSTQDPEYPYGEETILVTESKIETNTLLVVFSEKQFRLSLNNKGEYVPEVELNKFYKWLQGLRIFDETMQTQDIILTIKK